MAVPTLKKEKAEKKIKEKKEKKIKKVKKENVATEPEIPSYDRYGNVQGVTIPIKVSRKSLYMVVGVVTTVLGILYLPEVFHIEVQYTGSFMESADISAIRTVAQYVKDCPDDDFDGDGLINCMEDEYRTSQFLKDSDKDGVSDYAEVITYKTDPLKFDSTLVRYLKEKDKEEGATITTPYEMNSVILWADDYNDKAYGGVIETFGGYRFQNFNGWASFPTGKYAYKYEKGRHTLLDKKENAWRIDGNMVVLLYEEELEMVHRVSLFGKSFFVKANHVSGFFSAILPDHAGFFQMEKIAKADADPDITGNITVEFMIPDFDELNNKRFGMANDALYEIVRVRNEIKAGNTVAVSLYSATKGENIGIACGYTADGKLLIYDMQANYIGYIAIYEKAALMLNEKGELSIRQWFAFDGLGYSSDYGDRLSFFAASEQDISDLLGTY